MYFELSMELSLELCLQQMPWHSLSVSVVKILFFLFFSLISSPDTSTMAHQNPNLQRLCLCLSSLASAAVVASAIFNFKKKLLIFADWNYACVQTAHTQTHTHWSPGSPTEENWPYDGTNANSLTHTHLPAEPLNLDIQDQIRITRQDEHMATKQSQEGVELWMQWSSPLPPWTRSHGLSQLRESAWRPHDTTLVTLGELFWQHFEVTLLRPTRERAPHAR